MSSLSSDRRHSTPRPSLAFVMSTKGRTRIFSDSILALCQAVHGFAGVSIVVANDARGHVVTLPEPCRDSVEVVDNLGTGYAANMNTGAKTVRGDYYVFIDNDIVVGAGLVEHLYRFIAQYPNACLSPNWIYPPHLMERLGDTPFGRFLLRERTFCYRGWYRGADWDDEKIFEPEMLVTNLLLVPRRVFEHVGGFNEDYTYLSIDDEFSKEAGKLGYRLFIDPTFTVFHNEEDRISLQPKLARLFAGGRTRRQRVLAGHAEYTLRLTRTRRILLGALAPFKELLLRLALGWRNRPTLDPVFFKLASALVMLAWLEGYRGGRWAGIEAQNVHDNLGI